MSHIERSRPLVAYGDGHDCPVTPPAEVAGPNADVVVGWLPQAPPWLADGAHTHANGLTVMAGYGAATALEDGRLQYVPTPLSAVPSLLATLRPDAVVVAGVRRGSELAFDRSVGWMAAAAEQAPTVIVEVDDDAEDLGGPIIPGNIVRVEERSRPLRPPPAKSPGEAEIAIARHVLSLLPEKPTLQFGPGSVADAIVRAIDRPVAVFSGLLTDAVALLAERGLLDGVAVGGYVWGSDPLVGLCREGRVRLAPVCETHDRARLAEVPDFVAINTALQIGLDGAVNVEQVNGRTIAGVGGHPDFCAGAATSPHGLSVIAVRSTHRAWSTIVPRVERVSTPGYFVDVVVTEHGIADLRGAPDDERVRRLIDVAHPAHREALQELSGLR